MEKSKYAIIGIVAVALSIMAFQSVQEKTQPETMALVPMMRLLLDDMYTVDEGIYTENFTMIEEGATAIADHPVMTEEDKKLVKEALGEEMKQFIRFDMTVHHHADSMAEASRNERMAEVIRHYQIVQQGCVDCHSAFRTKIMEARK